MPKKVKKAKRVNQKGGDCPIYDTSDLRGTTLYENTIPGAFRFRVNGHAVKHTDALLNNCDMTSMYTLFLKITETLDYNKDQILLSPSGTYTIQHPYLPICIVTNWNRSMLMALVFTVYVCNSYSDRPKYTYREYLTELRRMHPRLGI